MGTVTPLPRRADRTIHLGEAVQRFLARDVFEPATREAYRKTLDFFTDTFGSRTRFDTLTAGQVEAFLQTRWGDSSPKTYNRHRTCLQSFYGFAIDRGWAALNPVTATEARKVRRTAESVRRERPISQDHLERLWGMPRIPVRDKLLWRLAYESWGRASELLGLNIPDLDLGRREALVHAKGGDIETIYWSTGTARLLPRVIDGRTAGPLFLASKLPRQAMAVDDVDPVSGRARLSYRQAERLFADIGRTIDPDGAPWTLHRLRHSGISHAIETGEWNLANIRAKSRHASLRCLDIYANPSAASIQRMTSALDTEKRR